MCGFPRNYHVDHLGTNCESTHKITTRKFWEQKSFPVLPLTTMLNLMSGIFP